MKEQKFLQPIRMGMLLLLTCLIACFSGTFDAKAAEATYFKAFQKASYEQTSEYFELKVNGTKVDVVTYFNGRYDYAHLSYEGTTTFEIKAKKGNIQYYDLSPHSYNINAKVNGNTITFDLTQKKSRYIVFRATAGGKQHELFIAADPKLNFEKPDTSKSNVVDIVKDYKINTNYNKADGKNNSKIINQAIKDVSEKGGGTVYFPGNTVYKFVTIDSRDNVTLYLDDGAVLRGSGKRTDYDWSDSGANGRQAKRRDIKITHKNFSIIGTGMIDANSCILALKKDKNRKDVPDTPQPSNYWPDGWDDFRKGIVDASGNASNIRFEGITFKDATGWTFSIHAKGIEMHNVKMLDDYKVVHSDGYDIASSQNVNITNCLGICGDDVFCPKASNSNQEMKNYLYKDCVAYARGGAGCKIGMQAQSRTDNIEFNNIDVVQGYRGFCIAHDDGSGEFSNIRFIDIRTEKIWINNTGNKGGQFRPAPFTLWTLNDGGKSGKVHDVEVTRCSFEDCASLPSVIKGELAKGEVSNITFTDLVMNGKTVTSENYKERIEIGDNVKKDTIKFQHTKLQKPSKVNYEAEYGNYSNGAGTKNANDCFFFRKAGTIGKNNNKEATVTIIAYVEEEGPHTVDVYGCVDGTRSFQIYVNGKKQKKVEVKGSSFNFPVKVTTELDLKAGKNEIKFGNPDAAAPDLDRIVVYENGGLVDIGTPVEAEWGELSNGAKVSAAGACSGGSQIGNLGGNSDGAVSYTLTARFSGKYKLALNYSTKEDRKLKVTVNNRDYTVDCPATGSYTEPNKEPLVVEVELDEGLNVLKFSGVNKGDAPNLDKFLLTEREITYLKVEAENGVLANGAKISDSASCSNEKYVGFIGGSTKGTATYNINCEEAGKRVVQVYYCTEASREFKFSVNGKSYNQVTGVTADWGIPCSTPLLFEVEVKEGTNVIELSGIDEKDAPNLDAFEIEMTKAEIDKENAKPNGAGTDGTVVYTVVPDKMILSGGAKVDKVDGTSMITSLGGEDAGAVSFNVYAEEDKERTMFLVYAAAKEGKLKVIVNGTEYEVNCDATESETVASEKPLEVKVKLSKGKNVIEITGAEQESVPNLCGVSFNLTSTEVTETDKVVSQPDRIAVTDLILDNTSLVLIEGGTATLIATVMPENATDKTISWQSVNPDIATVKDGVVTAVKEGTTAITVTTTDGNVMKQCQITVTKKPDVIVPVENVVLDQNTASLCVGDTVTLTATIMPENATYKTVEWKSSNRYVATVENGVVTAVRKGTATITVTTTDGNKAAECEITITEKPETYVAVENITLNPDNLSMEEGKTATITAIVTPEDATNKNVTWKTENPQVATVENGVVTAVKAGNTKISATAENGTVIAECIVVVAAVKEQTPQPQQPSVEEFVKLEELSITGISKKIAYNSKVELKAEIVPENASVATIQWSSSNAKFATVEDGVVTTKKAGKNKKVTITAKVTMKDGSVVTEKYKITIMPQKVKKLIVKVPSKTVKAGSSIKIKASVTPNVSSTKINKKLKWISSNKKIATVSASGVVKTKKAGKNKSVKITVMTTDGSNKKKVITLKIR